MGANAENQDLVKTSVDKPIVAVWMVTYNHEAYIEKAIESVMMQQTDFSFKLFIGEDCSTDNTREICKGLKAKYPQQITLFLNEKNLGVNPNAVQVYNAVFGSGAKYIAMLEGDDYWTNSLKLQKQVDFLEANPEYVLCFHQIEILKKDGEIVEDFITKVPENPESIITLARYNNYIHTPTVVYRNVIAELPFEFRMTPIGDYFLYMILAEQGKIKYLQEKMAVYRYDVGIISEWSLLKRIQTSTKLYSCMISYLKDEELKKLLIEKQLKDVTLYYNLMKNEYKHHFVSDHFFFRGLKFLLDNYKNPLQILGKIKNRTLKSIL